MKLIASKSTKLRMIDDGPYSGFSLEDPLFTEDGYEPYELITKFPEVSVGLDEEGKLRYFTVDLWAGPDFLDHIIAYFEKHPIPGTYAVEELGLHDVSFVEVLKAIKRLYKQKLTAPTEKRGK